MYENVEFMMRFSYTELFVHAVLLVKCQFKWILHVIYSDTVILPKLQCSLVNLLFILTQCLPLITNDMLKT